MGVTGRPVIRPTFKSVEEGILWIEEQFNKKCEEVDRLTRERNEARRVLEKIARFEVGPIEAIDLAKAALRAISTGEG